MSFQLSAVSLVAQTANNALSVASLAGATGQAAYDLAVDASSNIAQINTVLPGISIRAYYGYLYASRAHTVSTFNNGTTRPIVGVAVGSKFDPMFFSLASSASITYAYNDLTPAGFTNDANFSDLIKIVNLPTDGGYTLTVGLYGSDNTSLFEYIMQSGESLSAFYNGTSTPSREWVFTPSLL